MPLRFSRFQGSKLRSINELNQHINLSNCTRYIEPFAGSCSIYLNLNQSFIEYIISDKNIYTYKMYLAFKEGTFEKYNNFINDILKTFGDIKFCKECYYNYREWYNEVFFRNVNKDYILEGFAIHTLYNTCINSFARYGKNGFNQSFGHCQYKLSEIDFNQIKNKFNQCKLYNVDYLDLLKYDSENTLWVLDPPYLTDKYDNPGDYSGNDMNVNSMNIFLEFVNKLKGRYILTHDENNTIESKLNCNKSIFRKRKCVKPGKQVDKTIYNEIIYYN